MLTVENYNCQYLKLDSPTIQKLKENLLLETSEFTKVELEYNINCGETPIKKELQYTHFDYWSIDLSQNIAKNDILDEIIFKHIITGQEFSIDNLNINMSTATVGDYLTAISDLLIDNGLSTVGLSVVLVGNELRITGLPTGIVPISFNMSTTVEIFLFNFNSFKKIICNFKISIICIYYNRYILNLNQFSKIFNFKTMWKIVVF